MPECQFPEEILNLFLLFLHILLREIVPRHASSVSEDGPSSSLQKSHLISLMITVSSPSISQHLPKLVRSFSSSCPGCHMANTSKLTACKIISMALLLPLRHSEICSVCLSEVCSESGPWILTWEVILARSSLQCPHLLCLFKSLVQDQFFPGVQRKQ